MFRKITLIYVVFLLLFSSLTFAATTGKIAGTVTDEETGEKMVGVNVYIQGTHLGASTDIDGNYFILNIPPGSYAVIAEMIGYATTNVTAVRVNADRTTIVDFPMKTESVAGNEVVVVAEREVVPLDVASSKVSVVVAEAMENSPIRDVRNLLRVQAGIESGPTAEDIVMRGGGGDQILMLVDGASLNDERRNRPFLNVPLSAVESVDIITGGFNAEYGNVRSGMLQLNTKEGGDKYTASFDFRGSPPHYKHFGDDKYWTQDWNRWGGVENMEGDETFEGWIAFAERLNNDEIPDNDITAEDARAKWEWFHRPVKYGKEGPADYQVEGSFGGPIPMLDRTSFFFSGRVESQASIVPYYQTTSRSQLSREISSYQLKLTSWLSNRIKLNVTGLYSVQNWLGPQRGLSRNFIGLADWWNDAHVFKYQMGYSPFKQTTAMVSARMTHTLSQKTFYNAQIERFSTLDDRRTFVPRDTSDLFQLPNSGEWLDETPWGHYDAPRIQDQLGVYRTLGWPATLDSSSITTWRAKFDIQSQINTANNVKAGVEVVYSDLKENMRYSEITNQVEIIQKYTRNPVRASAFIQNKLEWEGMIANFGLRMDYNDADGKYHTDPFSPYYSAQLIDSLSEAPGEKSKSQLNLQPRLGVSHPIGKNTKIYFNYGHFYSVPTNNQYYGVRIGSAGQTKLELLGNPNLEIPRTVAYELGYDQNLLDAVLLHFAGYYRNISDQTGVVNYVSADGTVNYDTYTSQNYEDIFGLEFRAEKTYGRFFHGWVNYNWVKTTNVNTGFSLISDALINNRERADAVAARPLSRPSFRASVDLHTPTDYGQIWGGWALNLLYTWREGGGYNDPTTPEQNDYQWVPRSNTNLRLSKKFDVYNVKPAFYMVVNNLFNQKYLNRWVMDGSQWLSYIGSLREGDRVGIYPENGENEHLDFNVSKENEWAKFLFPRSIELGLRVNL